MPTFYSFFDTTYASSLRVNSSSYWNITGTGSSLDPYLGPSNIQLILTNYTEAFISFRTRGTGTVYWSITGNSSTASSGKVLIDGTEIYSNTGSYTTASNQRVINESEIKITYIKYIMPSGNGLDRVYINYVYFVPDKIDKNFLFDDIFVPADYFTFGNLSSWGLNSNGQLGLNNYDSRNTPTKVYYNLNDWKKISAGQNFASAIRSDGALWTWGYGADGQLGSGSDDTYTIPYMLTSQSDFLDVSCGESHIGAIKSDGSLWMWGNGGNGRLGNYGGSSLSPIQSVSGNRDWKKISCGYNYTFAISIDDLLWAWGGNDYGQIGTPSLSDKLPAVYVSGTWSSVSCAKYHTAAITTDGFLYSTGTNTYGQLGTGNLTNMTSFTKVGTDNNWKHVSCAENHTIAIKTNGTMWSWGNNDTGQLGFGVGIASTSKPIQVGSDINWKQVSCGSSSSSAIKTDGSLWTWGLNDSDQLGLGDGENPIIYLPTQIGTDYDWKQVSTRNFNFYAIKYSTLYV